MNRAYVFFDMDDTLVEWVTSWEDAFARAAAEEGVHITRQQAFNALNEAFSTIYGECLRSHAAARDESAFWLDYDARIFESLGVREGARRAAQRVAKLLQRPDAIALYPEVRGVLEALADRGARLGIITGRPRALPDLEALGVAKYFDLILDGLSFGEAKQVGGVLFRHAAEVVARAGLVGWHVGDSLVHDVEAATAAGFRAVLVDRRGRHPGASCLRVESLDRLPDLISSAAREDGA